MKIDRLLNIIMILISKKKVTAKELADYFEVSVRTIQRDMDHLMMSGIPIYTDVGKNGGYYLVDNYKLDKNFLKAEEANLLMAFLKNLEKAVPYSEIKTISNKFSALLPNEEINSKIVVNLNPLIVNNKYKKQLEIITYSRDKQRKVLIKYLDADFRETDRIISPYTVVMIGTVWYVYGFCDLREDFRLFKLTRIVSCETLQNSFDLMPLPKDLPWENNMDSKRKSEEIILEVDKALQGKIPDYFDYETCEVLEDKLIATLNFPVDEWLYSLLLGLVPYVKILEPKWIREEFISRLELGIKKQTMT